MKWLILTSIIMIVVSTRTDPIVIPLFHYNPFESNITKDSQSISTSDKYNFTKRQNQDIQALHSDSDVGYLGGFWIGEPRKFFWLLLDTGSWRLWVLGSGCKEYCEGHHLYDLPETANLDTPYSANYADVSYCGKSVTDIISFAYAPDLYEKMEFGVCDKVSSQFNKNYDGIIGMSYNPYAPPSEWSFIQRLYRKGSISQGIFSVYFARQIIGEYGSHLMIGGYDPEMITTVPNYNIVLSTGEWTIEFSSIKVNNRRVFKAANGVIDTGTSLIGAPRSDAQRLYKNIRGASISDLDPLQYTLPCDRFPTFSFIFNKIEYGISEMDMNLGPEITNPSKCISAIQIYPYPYKDWTIGLTFLRNVYTIFDMANRQIGFAFLKSYNDIVKTRRWKEVNCQWDDL